MKENIGAFVHALLLAKPAGLKKSKCDFITFVVFGSIWFVPIIVALDIIPLKNLKIINFRCCLYVVIRSMYLRFSWISRVQITNSLRSTHTTSNSSIVKRIVDYFTCMLHWPPVIVHNNIVLLRTRSLFYTIKLQIRLLIIRKIALMLVA